MTSTNPMTAEELISFDMACDIEGIDLQARLKILGSLYGQAFARNYAESRHKVDVFSLRPCSSERSRQKTVPEG